MASNTAASGIVRPARRERIPVAPAITLANRIRRLAWKTAWAFFARFSPTPFHVWRRMLARLFGARLGAGVHIYPRADIWAPWNLTMGARSCLANGVQCYNVADVVIGDDVVVSQDAWLCTATHDYDVPAFPLL